MLCMLRRCPGVDLESFQFPEQVMVTVGTVSTNARLLLVLSIRSEHLHVHIPLLPLRVCTTDWSIVPWTSGIQIDWNNTALPFMVIELASRQNCDMYKPVRN